METVKKTDEYEIVKKRSGRYGVRDANRKWVSGDEKVKILLAEKLITAPSLVAKASPSAEASEDKKAEEPAAEDKPATE